VAFWSKDNKIYNKVIDLLSLDGESTGKWTDEKRNPVSLIEVA